MSNKYSQWVNNCPANQPFRGYYVGKVIPTNQGLAKIVDIFGPNFKTLEGYTPRTGITIVAKLMTTGEQFSFQVANNVFTSGIEGEMRGNGSMNTNY